MNKEFFIFTPGPVKMSREVLEESSKQLPYFRNQEFSNVLLDCEKRILDLVHAPQGSRAVFLTASGTGAMEAVTSNLIGQDEVSLVVNGGTFGQRFIEILNIQKKKSIEHKVEYGSNIDPSEIETIDGVSAIIVNGHETSTGTLYDLNLLGRISKEKGAVFIVDAISMFLADELDMAKMNIDCLILSSQKGLALAPGLSVIVLSPRAVQVVKQNRENVKSLYFRLSDYLVDGDRGQTPFTPALSVIYQLYVRLHSIDKNGGAEAEIKKTAQIASYFREQIKGLPLGLFSKNPSNAVTSLTVENGVSAHKLVQDLERLYKIQVCPNGGELKDKVFRVAHMGDIDVDYTWVLVDALKKYFERGSGI